MSKLKDIKLKICGLRDNIHEVADLQPDFMGFIFYEKSPRFVGYDFEIDDRIKGDKIGVFVNQAIEEVLSIYKKYQLDHVQLHGNESVDYCVELKGYGISIIKVFGGNKLPSQFVLDAYNSFVDYYLFDTKTDKEGGTGISFDWENLLTLKIQKPIFLSGGLSLENIKAVEDVDGLDIFAIDVNSRFELSPGLKDIESLKKLKSILKDEI
jgi:phosphoribosylanthranilate isomerase